MIRFDWTPLFQYCVGVETALFNQPAGAELLNNTVTASGSNVQPPGQKRGCDNQLWIFGKKPDDFI